MPCKKVGGSFIRPGSFYDMATGNVYREDDCFLIEIITTSQIKRKTKFGGIKYI